MHNSRNSGWLLWTFLRRQWLRASDIHDLVNVVLAIERQRDKSQALIGRLVVGRHKQW